MKPTNNRRPVSLPAFMNRHPALLLATLVATLILLPSRVPAQTTKPVSSPAGTPPALSAQLRGERPQRIARARQQLLAQMVLLGADIRDTFEVKSSTFNERGELTVRFQRYHQGIRVLGAGVKVKADEKGGAALMYSKAHIAAVSTVVPAITETAVKEIIARDLKLMVPNVDFRTELVIDPTRKDTPARLVWLVRADNENIRAIRYYVDAMKGTILRKEKANKEAAENGTGFSQWSGQVTITSNKINNQFKLEDPTRGGTFIYNAEDKKPTAAWHGSYYWGSNHNWGNGQDWKYGGSTVDDTGETAAVDAMYGARVTWDLWKNVFSRLGYDDDSTPMKLRVHHREKKNEVYGDANWDGFIVNLGDGGSSDAESRTSLDTVSHELGHGLWEHAVAENDPGEANGLNEGHGDILSGIVQHYAQLADGQGNTIPSDAPRDISLFRWRSVNPLAYTNDGQTGLAYYPLAGTTPMEDREEHVQGTVYGRMFATLAAGAPSVVEAQTGTPCPVTWGSSAFQCLASVYLTQGMAGIGIHDAARIWYKATTEYFDEEPTFNEVRSAWLSAADWLFGSQTSQYKSVMNAFAAVRIGEQAVDTSDPTISIGTVAVNHEEESAFFEAEGKDDIGVRYLRFTLPGSERVWPAASFRGYVDLSQGQFGQLELTATAEDAMGKQGQTRRSIVHNGANFVIQNRGFEKGVVDWTTSGNVIETNKAANAFLGSSYASFSQSEWIRQQFSAPQSSTSCSIGYRLRVNPGGDQSGLLHVEILQSDASTVQQVLNTVFGTTDTTSASSGNYKSYVHSNVGGCGGGTRHLRIRAQGASADQFQIDNVWVVYHAPITAQLTAEADSLEGSVVIQLKNIQGLEMNTIQEIRWTSGGITYADRYAPFIIVRPTSEFTPDLPYNISASLVNHAGSTLKVFGPVQFVVKPVTNLVQNPSFEAGLASWTAGGTAAACGFNPAGGQAPPGFTGNLCAYFSGNGWLEQTIALPNGPGPANLTFRLKQVQGSFNDKLHISVQNTNTGVTTLLLTLPGNVDTLTGVSHMNYRKFPLDLTTFKGQNIRLRFEATATGVAPMLLFLDNVGVSTASGGLVLQ